MLICVLNRLAAYTIVNVFGNTIINLALAVLIHRAVYLAKSPLGRVLNWRPIAFVGGLSYSIYLWQQFFLNRNSSAWINVFPQNLVLTIAAALASYFLLEQPLLSLRKKLRTKAEHRDAPAFATR